MERTVGTIVFDGQFWVAVVERFSDGGYSVARHVFGPEPSNAELLDWASRGLGHLRFTAPEAEAAPAGPRPNPKRLRREVEAQRREERVPSKAQDALRRGLEARRKERRVVTRAMREAEERRRKWLEERRRKRRGR